MRYFKRKLQSPCRAGLQKFLDIMGEIENDKDEFLKKARLSRHEAAPVVTANNVLKIAAIVGGTVVLSVLIICAYFSGEPWALFIAACVSLLGFLIVGLGLAE